MCGDVRLMCGDVRFSGRPSSAFSRFRTFAFYNRALMLVTSWKPTT